MRWPDSVTESMDVSVRKLWETVKDREAFSPWSCKESDSTEQLNNSSFNPYDSPGEEALLVFPLC